MNLLHSIRVPSIEVMRRQGVEEYVLQLMAIKHLARIEVLHFRSPVTILVGDNGAGKSTLMEALAMALGFPALGGPLGAMLESTGTESWLAQQLTCRCDPILRGFFLRAETQMELVRNSDGSEMRHGRNTLDPRVSLSKRSHGESVRDLLGEHIDGAGIYLLDEPESGLSVIRQMALIAEIDQAVKRGGQFIIATHSPVLPAIPGAEILEIGESGIVPVSFEEVENVQAMKELLDDPTGTIEYLVMD